MREANCSSTDPTRDEADRAMPRLIALCDQWGAAVIEGRLALPGETPAAVRAELLKFEGAVVGHLQRIERQTRRLPCGW